jgi:hypothetical protein
MAAACLRRQVAAALWEAWATRSVVQALWATAGCSQGGTFHSAAIGLKLPDDGDSHSIEQWYPLILHSLHDRRYVIPRPSRPKLERTHYSASTGLDLFDAFRAVQ